MPTHDWREGSEQIYVRRALGTKDKVKQLQKKIAQEKGIPGIAQGDALDIAVNEALENRKGKHAKRGQARKQR